MYTNSILKGINLSASEYMCLRWIRKREGLSQEELRELLVIDKAAVTRLVSNLEKKGYVVRCKDEKDKRINRIFPTEKTKEVKEIATATETHFYQWLMEDIDEGEKEIFLKILKQLYIKSKIERRENFKNIIERIEVLDERFED